MSALTIKVSIPGQSRTVLVSKQDQTMLSFRDLQDKILEEVLFALFILLDENEE